MIRIFYLFAVILTILPAQGHLQHIIIQLDGSSIVGLVDSMNTEDVFITPTNSDVQEKVKLEEVYYIYNTFGKLYYVSPNFQDRLDIIEERSGFLITIHGDTLPYSQIQIDRLMDEPYVYIATENDEFARKLSIFDIHLIQIDASYMEHSVRRGFITGSCLILTGIVLQTFSIYGGRSDGLPNDASLFQKAKTMGVAFGTSIMNFAPGLSSAGNQYQSATIILPLSTIGWMVYDYMFDKRTHYFRPMIREDKFPHSMVWFNPMRIIKEKVGKTIQPLLDKWPF